MMPDPIDIYTLLPEVYRRKDALRGYPLKALLSIISEQATVVKEDIDRLWDNFFVETADDWVLPYIGDLIGSIPIHNVKRGRRADIAKTISYRLRKGTLPMLEELARDVTGLPVHAVAFFDILSWTQNMNHLRRNVGTLRVCPVDLSGSGEGIPPESAVDLCDRVHTAFDTASHSVDIRPFAPAAGWHHISKVGFFIWRLGSYELRDVQPRSSGENDFGYSFNPLGIRQHLFHSPVAESDDTGLAGEIHIARPIRLVAFDRTPEAYFGDDKSIGIRINGINGINGTAQTADDIACMDLSEWRQRNDGKIGVDVVNGRLSLPPNHVGKEITVSLHYGFSGDVGGGAYDRRDDATVRDPQKWVQTLPEDPDVLFLQVPGDHDNVQDALKKWNPETHSRLLIQLHDSSIYPESLAIVEDTSDPEKVQIIFKPGIVLQVPGDHDTVQAALDGWNPETHPRLLIQIMDSRTYCEINNEDDSDINPNPLIFNQNKKDRKNIQIIIQAVNGQRPMIIGDLIVPGADNPARLSLKGLLIEGQIQVETPGNKGLELIEVKHTTLVPGIRLSEDATPRQPETPSITVAADNDMLDVVIDHSITGPLRVAPDTRSVNISDSIVDNMGALPAIGDDDTGQAPGPECDIENSTIMGVVSVRAMRTASNCIFTDTVAVQRLQTGCMRFSYVPPGSVTPRRFRCEPDRAMAEAEKNEMDASEAADRVRPQFTTCRYGLPAYAQLSRDCAPEICTGADNSSEMGVFNSLMQPQREENLHIRFREYLPFGLEYGLIYVN